MMDGSYTEALWGKRHLPLSSLGTDRFIVDSGAVLLPTEFGFDWTIADRNPLISHGAVK